MLLSVLCGLDSETVCFGKSQKLSDAIVPIQISERCVGEVVSDGVR